MKTPFLWMGILLCSLSMSCDSYDEDDYTNYRKVLAHISEQYELLVEQYEFARFNFDQECIHDIDAPGHLLRTLIDSLTPFQTEIVSTNISPDTYWYEVDFTVNGKAYRFKTETKSDWVNVERLERVLGYIAEDWAPSDSFVIPLWPNDQALDVLFGPKASFTSALKAGLPIDNPSIHWQIEGQMVEGAIEYHLAVERPTDEVIKSYLLEGLADLDRLGYKLPQLNAKRVYITDLFKESKINLIIDGDYLRSEYIKVKGNKLLFSDYGYLPVVLWKMMQKHPEKMLSAEIEGEGKKILSLAEFEERFFAVLPRK